MKTIALPQPRLYFVNAAVDGALIGGASLVTFVLLRLLYTADRTPAVITLGAQLLWLGNWPHFAASSYRLYHTRENVAQYPVTALVIPFVGVFYLLRLARQQSVQLGFVCPLCGPSLYEPQHRRLLYHGE